MNEEYVFRSYDQYLTKDRYGKINLTRNIEEATSFCDKKELIQYFAEEDEYNSNSDELSKLSPLEIITILWF